MGWVGISPPANLQFPLNGCQIVCFKSFFGRDNKLQVYHANFLVMDNKHMKVIVKKQ